MTRLLLQAGACLVASWLLTGAMRRYALRANLLDIPNARSSHSAPTPRGGGVAFVLVFLGACAGLLAAGLLDRHLAIALLGAGLLVALLGFLDDRSGLPARLRFGGHTLAAVWVLAWIGPLPAVPVFGWVLNLGWLALALSAAYLVWSINLFNFMDGIDGIASVEAVTVCLCGAVLAWWVQPQGPWPLAVLFSACVGGFLLWNFPPARIFMGDAGSGFLGLVVATLALAIGRSAPQLFWAWFILGGCFMVDATTTLVRRHRRGEKVFEAHRSHAYQYASRVHGAHRPVTLVVAAINGAWLMPLATLVALGHLDGVSGVAVAFAPLVGLAFHYKAGDRAAQAA